MTASIIRGDARAIPMPDASVDLIVTSPPYFALRSYTDGGEHYDGQVGAEASPRDYIAALLECTREWMRVLKPSGSCFVNLGDKFASSGGHSSGGDISERRGRESFAASHRGTTQVPLGFRPKSLLLLPERYRIACIDELGLIARAVLVWSKPNGLPESVTDRVRRSHEDWVHLVKQPRYYSAVDAIRDDYSPNKPWGAASYANKQGRATAEVRGSSADQQQTGLSRNKERVDNPLGKLPGSVWEIATEPLKVPDHLGVDHFAAFPTEWPRRLILGWSPSGICTACGEGRRPTVERGESSWQRRRADGDPVRYGLMGTAAPLQRSLSDPADRAAGGFGKPAERTVTGEACACPDTSAPTRPAVVLDPFGGTGTTALVASVLGRRGVSVDMSADYCRLAAWRTTDPGQRAKAMRVEKPPAQIAGQDALFEVGAA